MSKRMLFSGESVTEGHPDKLCDQISDAILDAMLEQDPMSRVACETCATTGLVLVMGEITTESYVEIPEVVRKTAREIGYTSAESGLDADSCAVLTAIHEQSADIAQGVDNAFETRTAGADVRDTGAGDQGMMFGFACDQTRQLMPMPIVLAGDLCRKLAQVRKGGELTFLRPDGKALVTLEYIDGVPARVDSIVLSTQHAPDIGEKELWDAVEKHVIRATVDAAMLDEKTKILINPTGRFVRGGPDGDSGLTGRKIIVDTYGGYARHGGGAFSGKDPTKVDRSAAYAARHVAKNIVAANLARACEVTLVYAIGVAQPLAVQVDCFGTAAAPEKDIEQAVRRVFDLRPAAIIEELDLRRPIYRQTAAYGHFGRDDLELPWEKTDRVELIQNAL
ncbi:MAG: methionine adenosyltransferase [Christensenellales bacterium]|jgi:S-adenosylmethionine synthetase